MNFLGARFDERAMYHWRLYGRQSASMMGNIEEADIWDGTLRRRSHMEDSDDL